MPFVYVADKDNPYTLKMHADGSITARDMGIAVSSGAVEGMSVIHKFGKATDFDITDGFVTVWDGANDGYTGTGTAMKYIYSATANISQLSSTSGSDTQVIEIQGLDANWNLVVQNVTLNGTTPVDMTIAGTALIRVFRMKNMGTTPLAGTVHLSIAGANLTAGEPDALNENRAIITIGHNQTLMSVYSVPAGCTAYMTDFHASLAGAKRTVTSVFHLEARAFGGVFQTKHTGAVIDGGTSHLNFHYHIPEKFAAKTDIEIHANTDADVTAVSAGFDITLVDD